MNNLPTERISEIQKEYESSLVLPPKKYTIPFLLCPIGIVGAGKTTVMKPLCEKLALVRISNDEIRKLLKENGFNYDSVEDIAFGLTEKYLKQGYSIGVDSDCIAKADKIKKFTRDLGINLIWIHINPPEAFILNKLSNLKQNWLGSAEDMIKNYYARKQLHKYINFPFAYIFDTSKENLDEQIKEAVQSITDMIQKPQISS